MSLAPFDPPATAGLDVIVIGAGVIGMTTAWALRDRGLRVAVVERGEAGRAASWAGGGILAPLRPWAYPEAVWQLCDRSRALYPALAQRLLRLTGIDAQCLACGGARIGLDASERARAEAWHAAKGLPCHRIDDGLAMPWLMQVRNPRLVAALRAALPRLGVTLFERAPVRGLLREGGRIAGVEIIGRSQPLRAPRVVLAAGAWSGGLASVPVTPVRGQMLLLRPARPMSPAVYLLPDSYVIVRADGRVLTGSTMEQAGFDTGITAAARVRLASAAAHWLPALRGASIIRQWAGLRPGTADDLPRIAALAGEPGLWLNCGHHRNGLAMAPASAERLAALIDA